MKRSSKHWPIVFFLLSAGCTRTDIPAGLSAPSEAFRQASGARVLVRMDSSITRGELLAVEPDTLFLIRENTLNAISKSDVREAKAFLQEYPLTPGEVAGWTVLGTLSTISNGFGLVITAPLWLITGTVTGIVAAAQANHGDFVYPDGSWSELRKFARFPQGLPQGIPRERLKTASNLPTHTTKTAPRRPK